jgi:DNA polymerase elongation subunit (family B)
MVVELLTHKNILPTPLNIVTRTCLKSKIKVLDLYKIFNNNNIKASLYAASDISYAENGLDSVIQVYIGEGKMDGVSGKNSEELPPDIQLEYCLNDAILCKKITEKNSYEILQVLYTVSQEEQMDFFETCNSEFITRWCDNKFNLIGYRKLQEADPDFYRWLIATTDNKTKKLDYHGGKTFEPVCGIHLGPDLVTFDISSMYPSTCCFRNISRL